VREERKELNEKLKENREELKEKRTELKEELKNKQTELRNEAKEQSDELKQAIAKLRETRAERRKEARASLREKYGDLVLRTDTRDELRTHASRMARLQQIKRLADEQKNTKIVARADKLIERENTRHQKQMDALKAQPNTQAAAKGVGNTPGTTPAVARDTTGTKEIPAAAKGDAK
jgi:hypothetical protein